MVQQEPDSDEARQRAHNDRGLVVAQDDRTEVEDAFTKKRIGLEFVGSPDPDRDLCEHNARRHCSQQRSLHVSVGKTSAHDRGDDAPFDDHAHDATDCQPDQERGNEVIAIGIELREDEGTEHEDLALGKLTTRRVANPRLNPSPTNE